VLNQKQLTRKDENEKKQTTATLRRKGWDGMNGWMALAKIASGSGHLNLAPVTVPCIIMVRFCETVGQT